MIASALQYKNDNDPEAEKLQETIERKGYEAALIEVSQLAAGDPLITAVTGALSQS
ncbi:hypothetical protein G4V62_11790 [Bacillaceae bacterium SIJ1]|uniref:hypothetical protein n=1 Tax=Litoribacterium kuwaitense TaxID=1398745 RepID=UPI0013EBA119|nr:hypothetical protein [Litoribacterium kuwaitense]NGP45602.1 hypothetical protein [Litoribacterium kuwaitense]